MIQAGDSSASSMNDCDVARDQASANRVTAITVALTALSVFVGIAAYNSWAGFSHFARVETKRNDAAMELEINALGSSLALLQYFVDHDSEHFLRLQNDREDFQNALQGYRNTSANDAATADEFTKRAAIGLSKMHAAGNALCEHDERIRKLTSDIFRTLAQRDPHGIQTSHESSREGDTFYRKFLAAVELHIAQRDHSLIDQLLDEYSPEQFADRAADARLLKDAQDLAIAYDRLLEKAEDFSQSRTDLDNLLDDEVQAASTASMQAAASRTWFWALVGVIASGVLVVLAVILGCQSYRSIRRLLDSKQALAESRDRTKLALNETAALKAHADRLALVAKHTDNAVIITNAAGGIEWVNEGYTRTTGYQLDEVKGKSPGSFLQGEKSDPKVVRYMRRQIAAGESFKAELINYDKHGEEYWVGIEAMPLLDDEGQLNGFFAIERNLTADKVAAKVISDTQNRLQAQVEAIDRVQGRVEFTTDGIITDVNVNFAETLGYSPSELIGTHHSLLVPEEVTDSEEYRAFWRDLREGCVKQGDFTRIRKNGTECKIHATYAAILDENGKITSIMKYATDQTQRQQLEQQLSQAQKLESIGQLAAGVAHEINTPMQYVRDNIDYLRECSERLFHVVDGYRELFDSIDPMEKWGDRISRIRRLTQEYRFDYLRKQMPAAIEESREGVERTVKIVRAMKQFSHPGAREMKHENLNRLIESTIAISRNRWKYIAELELDLDATLPDTAMLASEINQALLNLIVNAGDAIAEKVGSEAEELGKIVVRTFATDEHVVFEISDNGCGMPIGIQQKVFDPFFTTKDVGKGTGQGLSITHNVVVNMHGGAIDLESVPGEGTRFTIKLPLTATETLADSQDPTYA